VNTETPRNEDNPQPSSGPAEPEPAPNRADDPVIEPPQPEAPESKPFDSAKPDSPLPVNDGKPRRSGSLLSLLALLVSLAALAGAAWVWWQDQADTGAGEEQLARDIASLESSDSALSVRLDRLSGEVDALGSDDVSGEFETLRRQFESGRAKQAETDQALQEQLALSRSLQAALDSMQARLAAAEAAVTGMSVRELDAAEDLDLAEIDYLLRLANERLKLFSDPEAADRALEVADMHLAALDNPMYLSVRQEIASARQALKTVEVPDYLAVSAELDAIQQSVPGLAIKGEKPAAGETGSVDGEGWWDKVKNVFSGLVTVRRSTELENERISLQDKDFIRQRAWLQLEMAHLSLVRRDQPGFRDSLERSKSTLARWFEQDSALQATVGRIGALQSVAIDPELPDISGPWSDLRLLRAMRPASLPAAEPRGGTAGDQSEEATEPADGTPDDGERTE
jgi:uroporphyrin-3 C-methyltransferase